MMKLVWGVAAGLFCVIAAYSFSNKDYGSAAVAGFMCVVTSLWEISATISSKK